MSQHERLALARLKIERANNHIDCLNAEVRAFFDTNPYKVANKRDPDTRRLIYYIESVQSVPVTIAAITGDALHCLRAALDHLAQQLYLAGTGNAKGYRDQTSFPIAKSAKEFKSGLARKVEGMRQEAVDAICALEPYHGGKGSDLWTLHRLNNIDKHRLILTVGSAFRSVDLGALMTAQMGKLLGKTLPALDAFFRPADNLFPLEVGQELLIDDIDAEPNEKMQFRFDVGINEVGLIEGSPVLETVVAFRDRVSDVVDSFSRYLA